MDRHSGRQHAELSSSRVWIAFVAELIPVLSAPLFVMGGGDSPNAIAFVLFLSAGIGWALVGSFDVTLMLIVSRVVFAGIGAVGLIFSFLVILACFGGCGARTAGTLYVLAAVWLATVYLMPVLSAVQLVRATHPGFGRSSAS